ncbi:L-threonate dehydrogenase [Lichenifustis flavocetrariae]|uniref:L-threonate dehydrogenase n=1 Tax=Lichenifustis flavocetrariae TaxID=2949735 RepID=A0AA41Z879_9HYPH|nr:L-threonate dehydrogenase [Lichenifustis flavocetrariae]MCW6512323.1 NAD(P)-binding domain-containing protein [Lichenifustis flavocetrariae]
MKPAETSQIAVIGLGSMGLGVASTLLRAGRTVSGYDPVPEACAKFEEAGGRLATDPAAASRDASVVVIVVVTAAQTEAVLFGTDSHEGAVATMRRGGVVLSSATMAPDDVRRLAERCEAAGVDYLDAPMSGGMARAASGELTVMASGSPAAFALADPILAIMATTVYRLGDKPGIGASFKMVNQLLAGVHIAAACEAITFAKRLGLDINKVFEVITASAGNSWMFENRVPHVLKGDYSPASAVDIFVKDLGIVANMGLAAKFPTPVAASALQLFLMTSAAGMGRDDDASVARLFAQMTGLDLPGGAKAK